MKNPLHNPSLVFFNQEMGCKCFFFILQLFPSKNDNKEKVPKGEKYTKRRGEVVQCFDAMPKSTSI